MNTSGVRALVLLDDETNRNLLCDRLHRHGLDVRTDGSGIDSSCDICFMDGPALARFHTQILQLKQAAAPVYLPCLLVGAEQHNNSRILQQYRACIDQVLTTPLPDAELQIYLDIALRARRDSVALHRQFFETAAKARLAEERYRIVSELTSDYAYSFCVATDGAYVLEWITQAFEKRSGYTLDEVNRRGWTILIHPDDLADLRYRKQRLNAGLMDVREFRLIGKSGETRWMLDRALPIMADGKVKRVYGAAQDITEQKATKTALQASEHKNSELTRLVPVAVYQTDGEGNVTYVNERWGQFTGLPLKQAYGIGWKAALHPDDVSLFDQWQSLVKSGQPVSIEIRFRRPDGTIVWAHTWAEPQRADDGSVAGYIGTIADISERKQAEEALRQSEYRLRRVLETLPIGVWIIDATGNIVHGNDAGREIWGGARYIGIEQFEEYKGWWLDTGKRIEPEQWAAARAIRNGESSIDEEIEIECFDGTRKIILNSAVPLYDDQNNIIAAIGVNQDIGQRKRAEEELRTHAEILANMAEGVIVTDDAGFIFFTNTATERIYGYSAGELHGKHVAILKAAPADEAQTLIAGMIAALKERGHWRGEFESLRKNGETFTTAARTSRIEIAGKPYLISVQQDVTELKKAEEIRLRLAAIVQSSDDAITGTSLDGTILSWNPGAEKMYGYTSHAICGKPISVLIPPGNQDDFGEIMRHIAGGQGMKNFETRRLRKDGRVIDVSLTLSPLKDASGRIIGAASIARDITRKKKVEENLRLWGRALEASSNGIIIVDAGAPDQPIVYANHAFQQITGYTPDEVQGRNPRFLQNKNNDQPSLHEIRAALDGQCEGRAVLRNYRKDGQLFWNELSIAPVREADGRVTYFIGILNDITERKRYQDELEYQATHDALTKLPNRSLLRDRLQQTVTRAQRTRTMAAVLFIDLDRFKVVNDSIGHDAGDRLLCLVSQRLRLIFREGDTVARQSGDEFVVVLERIDSEQDAADLAQRLLHAMAAPFLIAEREIYTGCSIGIGLYPKDGVTASELLKNADAAMYRAKEEGRNTFRFYTADMNARAHLRFELEAAMRGAIGRREFVLHYQPQVDLASGRLIGFEALVRWQHPQLGLMTPGQFISLAEETGLIVHIGEWVLRESCRQAKRWQDQGLGEYVIAVNLSARQFSDCNLPQLVDSALTNAGLDAKYLELEITESLLMENPDSAVDILRALRNKGVSLSIDDFGTGYSSLGYLKRFSLDKLKIDRSFVRDITRDPDDAAIATAIIAMAHRLKLKVLAEGVETAGQLSYLRLHGCDEVQGYLFSPPLSAADCTQLLRTRSKFDLPSRGHDDGKTLLVIDNDIDATGALRDLLRDDYRILTAHGAEDGFEILANNKVDVVLADFDMHGMSGAEFLSRVRDLHPAVVGIILNATPAADTPGTDEFERQISKPWDERRLRETVAAALRSAVAPERAAHARTA